MMLANITIQVFDIEKFGEVRWFFIGEDIWFVAADICKILDLNDVSRACSRLDNDEKGTRLIRTHVGEQNMLIVNEPGLYRLVFQSRKPNAKDFQRKVYHEVLPQIRKTGMYGRPQTRLEMYKEMVRLEEERLALEAAYKDEKKRADENQEVKELYDTSVAQNNYWIPMKAVADILDCVGVGRTNLYRFLRDEGVLTSKNEPMRQYQENGFMKTSYYSDWLGQYVCVVSFKGLKFIFKKLKNANKIPRSTTFDDWVALCKDMVVQDDKSESILTD